MPKYLIIGPKELNLRTFLNFSFVLQWLATALLFVLKVVYPATKTMQAWCYNLLWQICCSAGHVEGLVSCSVYSDEVSAVYMLKCLAANQRMQAKPNVHHDMYKIITHIILTVSSFL